MKSGAVGSLLLAVLMAASTASASTVSHDIDRTIDSDHWSRFAWGGDRVASASLVERRIQLALESGFSNKGYRLAADRENADFLIDYRAVAWRDLRVAERLHGPPFGRSLQVEAVPTGTLVVEVRERATGSLAWRGTVSDALARDPDKADKRTARAVARLLSKFPAAAQP